ncbi:ribosomal-protein-alanine N-acetyltransferase [Labrenzia sp. MBR-25]
MRHALDRSTIHLHNARPEETETLARIGLEAWLNGIAPLVPDKVRQEILADNPFLPFLKTLGPAVIVGTINGEPAGIGACEHADDTISDIWVAPAFEGRGVGSTLVRALETEVLGRGHPVAHIQVAALNSRAFGLYHHLGYREEWRQMSFDPILKIELEKVGLSKRL